MVKRLICMLFALIGLTSAWAANYGLKIGGVQLTSDNYTNITAAGGFSAVKSGTVTFNPTTKTLTLSNAVIEAEGNNVVAIDVATSGSGYKLQLASGTTNAVSSAAGIALRLYDTDFTIEGTGTVTFTSPKIGIYLHEYGAALTIRNCTLTATGGNSGITGSSSALGSVTIDGATVRATGTARGSIWCFNTLTLSGGVEILSPEGAVWNTTYQCICMPSNVRTPIMTEVVIGVPAPEPETVMSESTPHLNYDVNKDGRVSLEDLTRLANVLVGRANVPVTSVTMSPRTWSMVKGATKQLTTSVHPANADFQTLAWTTSNRRVATVDANGVVTGMGVGTCSIKATSIDGSNRYDSCLVTIQQPVTSIQLSTNSCSIANRSTYQLSATVLPSNAANKNVTWITSNSNVATVSSTGLITAQRAGTCTITCKAADGSGVTATCTVTVYWGDMSGTIGGHAYVDLGLPSGTMWATTNIGASSPEGYGNYYAWGETTTKSTYTLSNYFDRSNGSYSIYYPGGGLTELQTNHDAAYVNWGSNWCMPTNVQMEELVRECTHTWTTRNGVNGYELVGKNGNSIFLPAGGCYQYYNDYTPIDVGTRGCYWTRILHSNDEDLAMAFIIMSSLNNYNAGWNRYYGYSVRPVRKQ